MKADTIIKEVQLARSFEEAGKALDKTSQLDLSERVRFAGLLKSSFKDNADKTIGFQIIEIEPLNDLKTAEKPEFRVVARSPRSKKL